MSRAWLARGAAVLLGCLLAAGIAEGGARLVSRMRGGLPVLDEYEVRDPERPWLVRLRPGYAATLDELLAGKRERGRTLAVEHLVGASEALGFRGNAIALRINRQGFKGPEIDPSHARPRVLNIGDSCTFGSLLDAYSYPRSLERALRGAEVVNGGVEGYAPRDVLARIEEFRALRPEVVTIYLGWNALFAEPAVSGPERWSHAVRIARRGYERIASGQDERAAALEAYGRPKRPDRGRAERELEGYVPGFLEEVERIAREMRSAGSRVVLVTLPGLYVTDREPDARALR
ncbi:MAG TPA: SGNH/GDSL hydrolase family protein, partial [Longimicrobiaceae bacterium]